MIAIIIIIINGLLLLGFTTASRPADVMVLGAEPRASLLAERDPPGSMKRCRYSRPASMLQARCSGLELKEIPRTLQSDIQILDFSVNRLRDLKSEPLSTYTSLGFLYLQDNFILTIEEDAFTSLRNLQVLDITKNGAHDFPKSVLALPLMRKLFLGDNEFKDQAFEPIPMSEESRLQFLELSKNKLTRIPSIGNLPSLTYLNVSANKIKTVSTLDLAHFCSLEILDLSANKIEFNTSSNDCQIFNAWIEARNIIMKPAKFECGPVKKNLDQNNTDKSLIFPNETIRIFDACMEVIKVRAETAKAKSTWTLVGSCVGVSLFLLFLTLYCIHKRNNSKKKRQRLKQQQQLAANNANTELLNGNMPPEQT